MKTPKATDEFVQVSAGEGLHGSDEKTAGGVPRGRFTQRG